MPDMAPVSFDSIANIASNPYSLSQSLQVSTSPSPISPQQFSTSVFNDQNCIVTAKTIGSNHQCQITLLRRPPPPTSTRTCTSTVAGSTTETDSESKRNEDNAGNKRKRKYGYGHGHGHGHGYSHGHGHEKNTSTLPQMSSVPSFPPLPPPPLWEQQYQKYITFPNTKSNTIVAVTFAFDPFPYCFIEGKGQEGQEGCQEDHKSISNSNSIPVLFLLTRNGGLYYSIIGNGESTCNDGSDRNTMTCVRIRNDSIIKLNGTGTSTCTAPYNNLGKKDSYLLGMNYLSIKQNNNHYFPTQQQKHQDQDSSTMRRSAAPTPIKNKEKDSEGIIMVTAGSLTLNPPMVLYIPPLCLHHEHSRSKESILYAIDIPGLDNVQSSIKSIEIFDKRMIGTQTWSGLQSLYEKSTTKGDEKNNNNGGGGELFQSQRFNADRGVSVIIMGFQDGSVYIAFCIVSPTISSEHIEAHATTTTTSSSSSLPLLDASPARLIYKMNKPAQSIISICFVPTTTSTTLTANKSVLNNNNIVDNDDDNNNNNKHETTQLLCIGSLGNVALLLQSPPSPQGQKLRLPSFHTISNLSFDNRFNHNSPAMKIIQSASPMHFTNGTTVNNFDQSNGTHIVDGIALEEDKSVTRQTSSMSFIITTHDCYTYLICISVQQNHHSFNTNHSLCQDEVTLIQREREYRHDCSNNDIMTQNHKFASMSPQIKSTVHKLPLRKEMKYVSSCHVSRGNDDDNTILPLFTFITSRDSSLILVPNNNNKFTMNETKKKARVNNVSKTDGTTRKIGDNEEEDMKRIFGLLHQLSSHSQEKSPDSDQRNDGMSMNGEISKGRHSLSCMSSMLLSKAQKEDQDYSLKTSIINPDVISIKAQSLPIPKSFKEGKSDNSFTLHVFESIPLVHNASSSAITNLHALGKRDMLSNSTSSNVYFGGSAKSSNYPNSTGVVKHGVDTYKWDHNPMYSFASMSIQHKNLRPLNCCKSNIVIKNIKKRTRSSEYSSMYKNITKKTKFTFLPTELKCFKAGFNDCVGICVHIKGLDSNTIDLLQLLKSDQAENQRKLAENISATLFSRVSDLKASQHTLTIPSYREGMAIDKIQDEAENYKQVLIMTKSLKLMTPSTMKSMLFHRDECFMLGPFTTTNALCTQLIPSKGDHKPSVELAATGYMKSEIESLFVLLQASFKKQASYYYQNPKLLRYLDSEMKEHKCDIHEIISLYKQLLEDPRTKSANAYFRRILRKYCSDPSISSETAMNFFRKFRVMQILVM